MSIAASIYFPVKDQIANAIEIRIVIIQNKRVNNVLKFFSKRSRNSLSFITSIGSILWLGIAYTAGHAFFSTQLAPLLGVYWVISNHLYFNHDIQ